MTNEELFAATAVQSWKLVITRLNDAVAAFSDEQLQREVAPGRNRIYYLVGHLTAVHDRLLPMLGLGDRLHPELDDEFIANPDRTRPDGISPSGLRKAWLEVNEKLTQGFESFQPGEWLQRHSAVSEEDFAKEPLRNRHAVLMSRTNHASFHLGQIRLAR